MYTTIRNLFHFVHAFKDSPDFRAKNWQLQQPRQNEHSSPCTRVPLSSESVLLARIRTCRFSMQTSQTGVSPPPTDVCGRWPLPVCKSPSLPCAHCIGERRRQVGRRGDGGRVPVVVTGEARTWRRREMKRKRGVRRDRKMRRAERHSREEAGSITRRMYAHRRASRQTNL